MFLLIILYDILLNLGLRKGGPIVTTQRNRNKKLTVGERIRFFLHTRFVVRSSIHNIKSKGIRLTK